MKKKLGRWKFVLIPIMAVAFVSLVGLVVQALWNNLLPEILGVKAITFGQAIGIFVLCKILFGFGGKGGNKGAWLRDKMAGKFKNMTPEERETFKAQWEERCNSWKGRGGMGRRPFGGFEEKTAAPEENINPS